MTENIIENIPITKKWLADVIEKKCGSRPKIGTNSILDNSELGYMSMIRKVNLLFDEDENENLPKYVVLKIACQLKGTNVLENACANNEEVNKDSDFVEKYMHDTECNYYKLFSKYDEKPLNIPKIYSCISSNQTEKGVEKPVIVMELFENCRIIDLCDGFNEIQLYKIIDELIKLHIFSLTTEEWKQIGEHEMMNEMSASYSSMIKSIALNLSEQPGFEKIKVFIRNTFDTNPKFLFDIAENYRNNEKPSVICHGDLWAPQILWDSKDDLIGIIDWQISHRGSPFEDFHHLLSTCVTVENRKKLTKPLFDYYFKQLSKGLEMKGVKNPWTREEIDKEFTSSMIDACAKTIFSNGFWVNSAVLQTDGKPDSKRIKESFGRCQSFLDDTIELNGWN